MKVKLLKRLRREANSQITFYSVRTSDGTVTGMRYGMNDERYSGLFSFGDTKEQVIAKAAKIFFEINMPSIREKYKKYSVKNNY